MISVSEAQAILNASGFPCGACDGIAGPITSQAIARFQSAYDGPNGWLAIDGKFGPMTSAALEWVKANNGLASFFSVPELRCHGGSCCGGTAYVKRDLLAAMFKLRTIIGAPLVVVDAYRCPAHNAAVGGAHDSQHLAGEAFDPVKGAVSLVQAKAAGFTGIGLTSTGEIDHLDVRPGGTITFADPGEG